MIDVDFTKLELLLHCEALRALKNWADDFVDAINAQVFVNFIMRVAQQ